MKRNVFFVLFFLGFFVLLLVSVTYSTESTEKPVLIIATDTNLEEMSTVSERMKLDVFRDILASHWGVSVETIDARSVSSYDLANYRAVFVINTDNTPLTSGLLAALESASRVAFIGYSTMNEAERSVLTDVVHLEHEDVEFLYKGVHIFPRQSIDMRNLSDGAEIKEIAHAKSDSMSVPFIVESAERMFISLNLPNFYETNSHTTIFLSAVEDFLGFGDGARSTKALIRLEDVNPFTYQDTAHLSNVFSLLETHGAGFNVAVIPQYVNPPLKISLALSETPDLVELLGEYEAKGALTLIQHGYTHQTDNEESAIGFEFWDARANAPLAHDSAEFVHERVNLGREEIKKSGLPVPVVWETPHYALSELDGQVINQLFDIRYERTREFGNLPFTITRTYSDGSGVTFIPENLNYIESQTDIERIERELKQLGTITTSLPSFFWHPWRNISELEELLSLFRREGYTFVTAETLLGM